MFMTCITSSCQPSCCETLQSQQHTDAPLVMCADRYHFWLRVCQV